MNVAQTVTGFLDLGLIITHSIGNSIFLLLSTHRICLFMSLSFQYSSSHQSHPSVRSLQTDSTKLLFKPHLNSKLNNKTVKFVRLIGRKGQTYHLCDMKIRFNHLILRCVAKTIHERPGFQWGLCPRIHQWQSTPVYCTLYLVVYVSCITISVYLFYNCCMRVWQSEYKWSKYKWSMIGMVSASDQPEDCRSLLAEYHKSATCCIIYLVSYMDINVTICPMGTVIHDGQMMRSL